MYYTEVLFIVKAEYVYVSLIPSIIQRRTGLSTTCTEIYYTTNYYKCMASLAGQYFTKNNTYLGACSTKLLK